MARKVPKWKVLSALFLVQPVAWVGAAELPADNAVTGSYPHVLWNDAYTVLTAPASWGKDEGLALSVDAAAVVGTALLLDESVHDYVVRHPDNGAKRVADAVVPFGAEYSFGVLAAFYAGGSIAEDENAIGVAKDGLASSIIAAGIITPSLKYAVGRSRPRTDQGTFDFHPFSGSASFPSGHTTQAFAIGSVIAEHYESPWISAASYGMASLVGLARIEQNAHWASDVMAGAIIGSTVGKMVVHLNGPRDHEIAFVPLVNRDLMGIGASLTF